MILHRYKYCNATSSGVRPYNTQVQYTTPGVRRGYTNYHMNTVVFKYYQQVDVVRYIMISYLKHLHALHIFCSQLAHRYVEKESRRGYCFLHLKFDPP